jgi:hypothetical protein
MSLQHEGGYTSPTLSKQNHMLPVQLLHIPQAPSCLGMAAALNWLQWH